MKKMYKYLRLLPILLLGCNFSSSAQTTTFTMTSGMQTYTVPVGVTTVMIDAKGASGGDYAYGSGSVGQGGEVACTLAVVPGQILYVNVGGQGSPGVYFGGATGGYNGGGNTTSAGGSGGGSSDILTGGTALANRVIVAAGGGGTGYACYFSGGEKGGDGGGLTGENGWDMSAPYALALAGDQVSGFALGLGGDAGFFTLGGGGGGGYWGGNGGYTTACYSFSGNNASGGGGGSSYAGAGTSGVVHTPGINLGDGVVTICAPAVAGTIIGGNVCPGANKTFTNPTGTVGGVWSSSNTTIATVGAGTGIVHGVAPGSVIISYKATSPCGSATASMLITVITPPTAILGTLSVCVGSSVILSDASPGGVWSSVNTTVATIGPSTGNTLGVTMGGTTISYTDAVTGCAATALFTVNGYPSPIIGPSYACVGYTAAFTDPSTGGVWSSMPSSVGTIDPVTGILTGMLPGTTDVYYTVAGCGVFLPVTVNFPSSTISGASSLCEGNFTLLTIGFTGSGGVWSSYSAGTIAAVDPLGLVTGMSGGPDTIYYSVLGCPASVWPMTITTISPITGFTSICIGGLATQLSDSTAGGVWSSGNTLIATVSTTGLVNCVTGVVGSTTTISYTLPSGCLSTHDVYVNTPPGPITGPNHVCQGSKVTLADITTGGTWSSTNLSYAQIIDTTGVVTGVLAGSVTISYTLTNGCSQVMNPFTIDPPIPALINLTRTPSNGNPVIDTLCEGTPVTFSTSPFNGGLAPYYEWKKFGTLVGSGLSNTFTFTPIHGDVIYCRMIVDTGVCATADTVTDSVTFDIDSNKSPYVVITKLGAPDVIQYLGQVFTFYATVYYGGTSPTYQWYQNRAAIPGANAPILTMPVYENDTFYCLVTGNPPCISGPATGGSNGIIIYNSLGVNPVSNLNSTLSLFPNPNNGTLLLSGKINTSANNNINIEISDMLGRTIYSSKATPANGLLHEQINLGSNVADGSYLLHVNSEAGNEVFHFVIAK